MRRFIIASVLVVVFATLSSCQFIPFLGDDKQIPDLVNPIEHAEDLAGELDSVRDIVSESGNWTDLFTTVGPFIGYCFKLFTPVLLGLVIGALLLWVARKRKLGGKDESSVFLGVAIVSAACIISFTFIM